MVIFEKTLPLSRIDSVVACVKEAVEGGFCIFLLRGELASGKTSLVRAYVQSVRPFEDVTSPTFSLMHDYGGIYHYDLYRKDLNELFALGILENLEEKGTHFVEWGDERLEKSLKENGYNACVIEIFKRSKGRLYRITHG